LNFLAHLYLSGDSEGLKIGNFIADAVKGKTHEKFPLPIQKGIILHRRIDSYTDTHPIVLLSCKRLWDKYRHYSPVIVDIFYDHFLAANWELYSPKPLAIYVENCYQLLESQIEILPEKIKLMLPYMRQQNWLLNYAQLEGIRKTLTGMSKRTPFESGMEKAVESLEASYPIFKNEFSQFFEELQSYVSDEIKKLEEL
jgi:acyl carrier protein phosphodiesterase